jgi:hypothetical protein
VTRFVALFAASLLATPAHAEVDPRCEGLPKPADYDEQTQQDFQANYFALTSTFSGIHGAVPHKPGHGAIGIHLNVMPPLSCERRYVLEWTKTEDTNKSPVLPRLSATFALPAIKDLAVFYGGLAFLPPILINGTRNVVIGVEGGVGFLAHPHVEAGVRAHASMQRTYGDIATAFDPATEPAVDDVFVASTWGVDAVVSFPVEVGQQELEPFVSFGYLDASTFFFVGDSRFVANNLHPYAGLALAVGLDTLLAKHLRLGAELYAAPGGSTLPDPSAAKLPGYGRYGHLVTARLRVGVEF